MKRVVLVLLLAVFVAGCPKDPYRASLQASDAVSASVKAAVDITAQYYTGNLVNDNEKAAVGKALQVVTEGNIAFVECAKAAHIASAAGKSPYLACASNFVTQVSSFDPNTFGFHNPSSQASLKNYLTAVKTAIDGIGLAIQSAKGGN